MKKVIAVTMAAMVAGIAAADLSIDWQAGTAGAIYDVGGSGATGPFVEGGVVQLIWSLSPAVTAPGQYDVLGGAMLADEYLLLQDVTAAFGQGWGGSGIWANSDVGGNDISAGYFYTRIHQGAGAAGDFFVDVAQTAPVLATYSATDPSTTYSDPVLGIFNVDANGTTVIPEPATIGLMGIAGLGMYLARRKTRR
jgi:hypothetical protein